MKRFHRNDNNIHKKAIANKKKIPLKNDADDDGKMMEKAIEVNMDAGEESVTVSSENKDK